MGWKALTAGIVLAGTAAGAAVVTLAGYRAGFRYGGDAPPFVLSVTAAVIACSVGAFAVHRHDRLVGRWLLVLAGSLWIYLAATALAVSQAGVGGRRDVLAWAAVLVQATGHILPVGLLEATFLLALERLTGMRSRRIVIGLLAYTAAYLGFEVLTTEVGPYDGMAPLWDPDGIEALSWLAATPWMATVVIGPAVIWRSLARTTREARQRVLLIAMVSLVPIATIVFCVLSGLLAFGLEVLPVSVGEAGLAVAFGIPFILCPPGLAVALGPAGGWRLTTARASAVMTAVVGLSFALVVVTASAVVGDQLGAGSLLPVVVGTLIVAAVLAPLRRRIVRTLLLRADPGRARAAVLLREAGDPSDPGITAQRILRTACADPTLRLVLRLPEGDWASVEGVGAEPPEDSAAITVLPEKAGAVRAYLAHDPAVVDAAGPLEELRPLIDRAVLEAAIRVQAERLSAERARAEDAAATERRRLERDLHDGVQGRLLALALDLRMAERDADASAQLVLSDAAATLSAAIDELRALSAGKAPELLSRDGLHAALVELTHRMPVPIDVRTPEARLPSEVETVAYLVVCEAVTNSVKHAGASAITVDVSVRSGCAVVVVNDDGRGGADLRAGTGLRGLLERVGGAGGSLVVSDRAPRGTTLEAIIPGVDRP